MKLPAKLTVASTFAVHPPRNGGQLRIFHLYRHLARVCPVDVVALVASDERSANRVLAEGLREVRIPQSAEHMAAEAELAAEVGVPVTDVAFPGLYELTPEFVRALERSASGGGALVASHPYTLPALHAAARGVPLWYDAHNVEVDLKDRVLTQSTTGERLLAKTREVERACCRQAEIVLASSTQDAARLERLYRVPTSRVTVVPNGVDVAAIRFVGPVERRDLQARLRMPRPLALFIGSFHPPNIRAAGEIIRLASQLPDIGFAIAGSVGLAFKDRPLPSNVELLGTVGDEFKQSLLAVASMALNPVEDGSGTNMKMLDYLAAGVPVVSTEVGARGLELDLDMHVRVSPLETFASSISATLTESDDLGELRLRAARRHVEERFDWAAVAERLLARLAERSAVGA